MKSVIIHDKITEFAGSERVLECIYQVIPSPIYTLICNRDVLLGTQLENAEIFTTFFQKIPHIGKIFRNLLPFFVIAIEGINVRNYDLVISSSHSVAKNVLTFPHQYHICYCHTPMRYAWDLYFQYWEDMGFKKPLFALLMNYLRVWDRIGAERVDLFIANSNYTKERIEKFYGKDAEVLYPPVEIEDVPVIHDKEDYYITVSRLVFYKKVDLIMNAFNKIPHRRLIVIGDGPERKKLQKMAGKNINIMGYKNKDDLIRLLSKARGFIFAAEEDFGIAPVEAQGYGVPVIAFGKGGVLETVLENETGIFFNEQNEDVLIKAIGRFEGLDFDYEKIKKSARRFSKEIFIEGFKKVVESL